MASLKYYADHVLGFLEITALVIVLVCFDVFFSAMDISSDLTELGRTPVAVISAGVKSILDIPRTLEYLVLAILFPYSS